MKKHFEYIKKWLGQDQAGISKRQIINGVINLCNDALEDLAAVEQTGEADAFCECSPSIPTDTAGVCTACGRQRCLP